MSKTLSITLSVQTSDEAAATRIVETLSRAAIGFGLDDYATSISINSWEDEPDGT
jgi:hypothetical protein